MKLTSVLIVLLVHHTCAFGPKPGSDAITTFFAPYDVAPSPMAPSNSNYTELQTDLVLLQKVIAAAKAAKAAGTMSTEIPGPNSDFVILFCVYNLLDYTYLNPLVDAFNAGVFVQVLMDDGNVQKPYVPTLKFFQNSGLNVPDIKATQKTLTPAQKASLNLVPIKEGGLMHMKLRYFRWRDQSSKAVEEAVVSGSFNPENTEASAMENDYDRTKPVNLMYSRATPPSSKAPPTTKLALVRDVILELVKTETNAIFLSVYALRDLQSHSGSSLVEELCKASTDRGVAVAVVTDKGQSDGEAGFSGGDNTVTGLRLVKCGIPVFKAQSYTSTYSAFHHKNALFGLGGATGATGATSASTNDDNNRCVVVTDTANWSETTVIIDSAALDGGATGLRFLSNFLQSLRKYAYQQACPYYQIKGKKMTEESKNCAKDEPFNQPDWEQPPAATILSKFQSKSEAWPVVATTVELNSVPGCASSVSMTYSILTANDTTPATSPPPGPVKTAQLTVGAGGVWKTADAVPLPFGLAYAYAFTASGCLGNSGTSATAVGVADSAFDWDAGVRRSNDDLLSLAITASYTWPL
eukprot:gene2855-35273_t